jgi:hypothetical protein
MGPLRPEVSQEDISMKPIARQRLVLTLALTALVPGALMPGPAATMQKAAKKAIQLEDIINWKAIGATTVSNDSSRSRSTRPTKRATAFSFGTWHAGRYPYSTAAKRSTSA